MIDDLIVCTGIMLRPLRPHAQTRIQPNLSLPLQLLSADARNEILYERLWKPLGCMKAAGRHLTLHAPSTCVVGEISCLQPVPTPCFTSTPATINMPNKIISCSTGNCRTRMRKALYPPNNHELWLNGIQMLGSGSRISILCAGKPLGGELSK